MRHHTLLALGIAPIFAFSQSASQRRARRRTGTVGRSDVIYFNALIYAELAERHKGKLAPGYDADLIVLDRDLYEARAAEFLKTKVMGTFLAGRSVYPRPKSDQ